ncbi:hypothetical protein ACI65C_009838 [Semiaphis heraclei]
MVNYVGVMHAIAPNLGSSSILPLLPSPGGYVPWCTDQTFSAIGRLPCPVRMELVRRPARRGRPSLGRSAAVLAGGISVNANNVVFDPLRMCRICLCDKRQEFIDATGPDEPNLIQYVSEYYKIDIKIDDNENGKSTKLCQYCIQSIDIWRGQIEKAAECQIIVEFIASKVCCR